MFSASTSSTFYDQTTTSHTPSSSTGRSDPAASLQFLPSQYDLNQQTHLNHRSTFSQDTSGTISSSSGTTYSAQQQPSSSTASYDPSQKQKQKQKLSSGLLAAFGTSGYPGEPSLLAELGFNFVHIQQKTWTVLNPLKAVDPNIMAADSDFAGPMLFCLLFAMFLLLSGKVHFGYVYGTAMVGTVSQYVALNLMASVGKSIAFSRVASVLGYCMLPLVINSALAVVLSMDNAWGYLFAVVSIAWCTFRASAIFGAVLQLSEMRALIAYPLALFYGVFSIMTIFAEST